MDADEKGRDVRVGRIRASPYLNGDPAEPTATRASLNLRAFYVTTAARNLRLRALSRAVRRTLRSAAESQA